MIEELLSGSWFWMSDAMLVPDSLLWVVKTMDGTLVEMGPGDMSFGGDQGKLNHQGYCSWSIGDFPAELLLVQASEVPSWKPC